MEGEEGEWNGASYSDAAQLTRACPSLTTAGPVVCVQLITRTAAAGIAPRSVGTGLSTVPIVGVTLIDICGAEHGKMNANCIAGGGTCHT